MIYTSRQMRIRYLYMFLMARKSTGQRLQHSHTLPWSERCTSHMSLPGANTIYISSSTTLSPILASALWHIEILDTRGLQSNSVRSSEGLSSWWCIYCIAVLLKSPPFDPDLVFSAAETRYLKEWLKHFYKPRIIFSSLSSLMNLETVGNFW